MVLYNLAVRAYGIAIRIAALKHPKAALWAKGRKDWKNRLGELVKAWGGTSRIWVHCASYGEFEQGRPVMEALKKKYPGHKILLTFFSPSGYEPFKDWAGADAVSYIPLDTRKNARAFLEIVKPNVVFFIKYEFWLNFLRAIRAGKHPCYLVSAVFKPHHPFFKWYGHIFRKSLRAFTRLFVQDKKSGVLLKNIGVHNFEVCGDTRFDRVLQIRENRLSLPAIETFKGSADLIVAGSTWEADDSLVIDAFTQIKSSACKLLLVPHDIVADAVAATCTKLKNAGLSYSVFSKAVNPDSDVLVLDTVGMLAGCYFYGNCAYIGGGFNGGLHNSLEAAVFGLPVTFFGKDYTKFNEAVDLLELGAAENVKNSRDLAEAWKKFLEPDVRSKVNAVLLSYFDKNQNSTEMILSFIDF